ncbi:uncharacterized protein LODBEIA_P49780 [Lodderomyces beijingensis]|uniref:RING-type E3 ubiquitin transferase n=1 Tax=Lodderomyces beijingensis TaxID=1775926 RepID=A0ABP0ZRH5_9ASCO
MSKERRLPFADAATIVRAHQKDAYFESSYRSQIQDLFQIFKGQRFINEFPKEIAVLSKGLYLALTTLIGARTLGEEYVDLIYVNRTGTKLPRLVPRVGFILSYAVAPYLVSKFVKWLKMKKETREGSGEPSNDNWLVKLLSNYYDVLDTIMNLHIAVFYFKGAYYSISKRLFGLRYAYGHHKEPEKMQRGNYSLLGGLIIVQFVVKLLMNLKEINAEQANKQSEEKKPATDAEAGNDAKIYTITQLSHLSDNFDKSLLVDLADEKQLPYLQGVSRNCMLCLSPMVSPCAASCGHLYCWDCIVDWIRENPECPLCRQQCLEQHLLPLR